MSPPRGTFNSALILFHCPGAPGSLMSASPSSPGTGASTTSHWSPRRRSKSPYASSFWTSPSPRNRSTKRQTSRAHTASRRRVSFDGASPKRVSFPSSFRYRRRSVTGIESNFWGDSTFNVERKSRIVSQNSPKRVNRAMFDKMWVESRRGFPMSTPKAANIRSVSDRNTSASASDAISLARKLCSVFWQQCASSGSTSNAT